MGDIKATFLLPVRDNDGRDLADEIQNVRLQLWLRFFAYTSEGQVQGVFQMADGSQASDFSEKIWVIIEESRVPDLEGMLRDFKSRTLQEKIFLEIAHHVEIRLI
jgi:hypothetical protein